MSQPLRVIHEETYKSMAERDDNYLAVESDDDVSSGIVNSIFHVPIVFRAPLDF